MGFWDDFWKNMFGGGYSAAPSSGPTRIESRRANIQAMPPGGGIWITVGTADGQADGGYLLTLAMENSQRQFPDHRIRAVTDDGRLIDML